MRYSILILAIIISSSSSAFDFNLQYDKADKKEKIFKNRRDKHPAGINAYAFGPGGLANLSFDYFIVPKIAIEVGAGLRNQSGDIGYFVGGRYHIFGNSFLNLTPYIGIYTAFYYTGEDVRNNSLYLPLGIHKIKKSGLTWSAEVAYQSNIFTNNKIAAGFRLGYRF